MKPEHKKSKYEVCLLKKREPIKLHPTFDECGDIKEAPLRHHTKDQVQLHNATHVNAEADPCAPNVELTIYDEKTGEYWETLIAAPIAQALGSRLLCAAELCLGKSFSEFNALSLLAEEIESLIGKGDKDKAATP